MLLFVYTTTQERFLIFTRRYFKLSWNTTALSQSNCRNFSGNNKPTFTWVKIILYLCLYFYVLTTILNCHTKSNKPFVICKTVSKHAVIYARRLGHLWRFLRKTDKEEDSLILEVNHPTSANTDKKASVLLNGTSNVRRSTFLCGLIQVRKDTEFIKFKLHIFI